MKTQYATVTLYNNYTVTVPCNGYCLDCEGNCAIESAVQDSMAEMAQLEFEAIAY